MSVTRWSPWIAVLALCALQTPSRASLDEATQTITLQWTAPGDDGWTGQAMMYDVRCSRTPITALNYMFAQRVSTTLLPGPAGTKQTLSVVGLTPGVDYYFAVRAVDEAGNWAQISNVAHVVPSAALESYALRPAVVTLDFDAPRPNPSREDTRFAVTLPGPSWMRVEAFDVAGRKVRTIAMGQYAAGAFDLKWDLRDDGGRRLQPGTYMVRGQVGENVFLRRVTVMN